MPGEYRGASVDIVHTKKNNDQEQAGVVVRRAGRGVAATVYLEPYYGQLLNGVPVRELLGQIAAACAEANRTAPRSVDVSRLDFGSVGDRVQVQLVNGEANRKRLQGCPKKEIEGTDLAAVFRILIPLGEGQVGSMPVTDRLMDMWGMDVESLYKVALENTVRQAPARIFGTLSVLSGTEEPLAPGEVFHGEDLMYVLTNQEVTDGATTLLYPGLLQSRAEQGGCSFYILPGSIHELMLVEDRGNRDARELQRMVREINRTAVDPREFLSDQVYYYDGREQKLSMAAAPETTRGTVEEAPPPGYGDMVDEGEELER